ncbi:hypothetical protein KCG44_13495 [Pacificimonas sp. WHA3]|uniref:Uncharacterized protein n=1 Tax=Pacificimonas pallii TaxID=2827236 RepID=A0ABS6SH97_9SPHN|nr:hypothetical protein [Pacificimonas pallii]MBV7257795.1 hypothetical protein [Pacificimonas pallii]
MATDDLELIDWPEKTSLSTSSRRAALNFPVTMKMKTIGDINVAKPVRVKSVKPVSNKAEAKTANSYAASAAPLNLRGNGNIATGDVSLRLDRNMPPGDYVASIDIAGLARDVSFGIVEDVSLRIRPAPVVIDTGRSRISEAMVSFENRGNVSLPVDVRGAYPLGREDPLAADQSSADSALAVLTAALSRAPRVLTEIGLITIDMPAGPFTLSPGQTHCARLSASWDAKLDPVRRYRAFVPVYAAEIEIAVITAIKPDLRKPATSGGGKRKRS